MDQPVSQLAINRRRRMTLAVGVALLATLCATAGAINRAVRPAIAASELRISEIRRGAIANTINASGLVVPVHEELVSSPFQTHVAKVHAKLGQQVKAGELLLQLDDTAIRLALDSVKEQLAQQDNRILGLTLAAGYGLKHASITPQAIEWLSAQRWPGNIRQLRQTLERTLLLKGSGQLTQADFLSADHADNGGAANRLGVDGMTLEQVERHMIESAMAQHQGNISRVAKTLGLSRTALYRRLERHGIKDAGQSGATPAWANSSNASRKWSRCPSRNCARPASGT
ncbi:MAG: two-component system response regulator [Massilia sp.]|nr:two-component system response regulator [Massilia sp.]